MTADRHERDDGFTLIEMLIVILILGALAAIAIFATQPFQKAAVEQCFDLEFMSMEVVEAAERAGIIVPSDDSSDSPECVPIALLFAQAVENPNAVVQLDRPAQQGQTMVAISAHRSGTANPTPVICSGSQYLSAGTSSNPSCQSTTSGWQHHGTFNVGSGSSGRGIAVWTKLPEPDEPTVIRANWRHPDGSWWNQSKSLIVGVFNRPLFVTGIGAIGAANSGTGATVTSLNLGSASGLDGPGVVIAALATRHPSSGAGPCGSVTSAPFNCVVFSGVGGIRKAAEQGSSVYTGMAWTPVRHGDGPFQATAAWSTSLHASGFTMVLNLFP